MNFSQEFWIQITLQALFIAFFTGVIWAKINYLTKKVEKHNKVIERMYNVESSVAKAHNRIDYMRKELEDVRG